jgi:hypothetical protein
MLAAPSLKHKAVHVVRAAEPFQASLQIGEREPIGNRRSLTEPWDFSQLLTAAF